MNKFIVVACVVVTALFVVPCSYGGGRGGGRQPQQAARCQPQSVVQADNYGRWVNNSPAQCQPQPRYERRYVDRDCDGYRGGDLRVVVPRAPSVQALVGLIPQAEPRYVCINGVWYVEQVSPVVIEQQVVVPVVPRVVFLPPPPFPLPFLVPGRRHCGR